MNATYSDDIDAATCVGRHAPDPDFSMFGGSSADYCTFCDRFIQVNFGKFETPSYSDDLCY